jgi:2'-5' RNA ligase
MSTLPVQRPPTPARAGEPELFYRVSGRLNRMVWRMPLPRRVQVRLSALVYRNPPMSGALALSIIDALHRAGMGCWINGGWGVDALAGQRTRVHRDLDLVIEAGSSQRAIGVLEGLGFHEWYRMDSDEPLFSRIVMHDHELAGRVVDLHPLDFSREHVELSNGQIEGRAVPCLSLTSQAEAHTNYRKRWRDRADVAVLRKLLEGSTTTLIVPVPGAEDLVQSSAYEAGIPAHITLLYPFLGVRTIDHEVEIALESLLQTIPAFDFTLSKIGRFPGVVYLAPDPVAPFAALVQALVERWPDRQPYGGAHAEVVPHLTVAFGENVPDGLSEQLPMSARVQEVWLMTRVAGRWVRRRSFPLGGANGRAPLPGDL